MINSKPETFWALVFCDSCGAFLGPRHAVEASERGVVSHGKCGGCLSAALNDLRQWKEKRGLLMDAAAKPLTDGEVMLSLYNPHREAQKRIERSEFKIRVKGVNV